ncbi:EVE domain-containing protein [Blastomonas aquatica]|uniref:Ubiquinol-cytochrome c reductase n=1 Tax=Blastomonas aquatica TaxID=1510276 RepID=A0ABQ1J7X2_9SPHN|nr:EVE domain-containing protein [Blastomonas aquatica]GGB59669.1 ubiquinol-cytochrome c reductase [Blastomonas aquatica]
MTQYWLMKSEPDEYGWADLVKAGEGVWDGVRNAQASNNLKAMQVGDLALFYHSRTGLEAVGVMEISAAAFPDPKDKTGRWVAVKVKPVHPLNRPVTLKAMKARPSLADMAMLRQSRLSVAQLNADEWGEILKMAGNGSAAPA